MKRKTVGKISAAHQDGTVLFLAMIVLLLLSLGAILAGSVSVMQNKMASAARNAQLAQLAAESALNEARQRVLSTAATEGADRVCALNPCIARTANTPTNIEALFQSAAAKSAQVPFRFDMTRLSGADASAKLAAMPVYLIEDLGSSSASAARTRYFRIAARGVGGTDANVQIVESVVPVPDPESIVLH